MRSIRTFLLAASLALGLASCALVEVKPLPSAPIITPQDQAMQTVNEAQILIGAIIDLLDEQRDGGIVTDEEYGSYIPALQDYFDKSVAARKAVRTGVPDAAEQAKMLKSLLLTLHQQIAMKARQ